MNIWIIMIVIMVLSMLVQHMLQSRFSKYSQVGLPNGMTGADVARKMLADHGIYDVKVVPTNGMLTDHFNPQTKTVALSEGVYASRSVAAAAVAAHECARRAACARICGAPHEIGTCAGGKLCFQHRAVGASGRSYLHQRVPGTSVDRNPPLRNHYPLQLRNPSCGDQRKCESHQLAHTDRHHRQPDTPYGD